MKRPVLISALVLLVLIAIAAALYLLHPRNAIPRSSATATSTPDLTGQDIFTDGEDGFSIRYPASDAIDQTFTSFYHLPAFWRANGTADSTGTPVIAIIGYRTASDHSYPRYFDAEVRIGVSTDPKQVAACTSLTPDQGETALPDVSLGGTPFKAFAFESAGMMQYLKGVSYRTVHEGKCVVIEQLETGSSYRDDPLSADDIPDATLAQKYQALDQVVRTFQFARP